MKRFAWLATAGILCSAVLVLVVDGRWSGPAPTARAAAKGLSVMDLMLVIHDGNGLLIQVRKALQGSGPADDKAWKSVQARAAVMASLVETILVPATPRKGDKASWKQKTTAYSNAVRALSAAAVKEDAGTAKDATTKLAKSCTPCHDAHK